MVLNLGRLSPLENISQYLELFLVVTVLIVQWGECSWYLVGKLEMLLSIL